MMRGVVPPERPLRMLSRVRPTPAARTFMRASPAPGSGTGRSWRTERSPQLSTTIAFMRCSFDSMLAESYDLAALGWPRLWPVRGIVLSMTPRLGNLGYVVEPGFAG